MWKSLQDCVLMFSPLKPAARPEVTLVRPEKFFLARLRDHKLDNNRLRDLALQGHAATHGQACNQLPGSIVIQGNAKGIRACVALRHWILCVVRLRCLAQRAHNERQRSHTEPMINNTPPSKVRPGHMSVVLLCYDEPQGRPYDAESTWGGYTSFKSTRTDLHPYSSWRVYWVRCPRSVNFSHEAARGRWASDI